MPEISLPRRRAELRFPLACVRCQLSACHMSITMNVTLILGQMSEVKALAALWKAYKIAHTVQEEETCVIIETDSTQIDTHICQSKK